MAQTQTQTQQTGEVEATNERGIKLGGRWLNYSQFHRVPRPETGHVVRVTLQRDRFITDLEVLDGAALDDAEGAADPGEVDGDFPEFEGPPPAAPPPAASDVAAGLDRPPTGDNPGGTAAPRRAPVRVAPAPTPAPPPRAQVPTTPQPPTRAALKAAALAAAAHFQSGKPDSTEDAVYETAYRFLAWLQDDDD
jgi:hypothetical protein